MKHINDSEDKNHFQNLLQELESKNNSKEKEISFVDKEINEITNEKKVILELEEENNNLDNDDWLDFQNENDKVRELIMMFKTKQCKSCKDSSSINNCIYYHNEKDIRRKPFDNSGKLIYLPNICIFGDQCTKKSSCKKSHNFYEINYHPRVFKTKECEFIKFQLKDIVNNHNYDVCPFYHDNNDKRCFVNKMNSKLNQNDQQYLSNLASTIQSDIDKKSCKSNLTNLNIGINQINFKTIKCSNSNKHNEKQCPFFHNAKDKRRPQNTFYYLPEICFSITSDVKCPKADYCNKCHNQVELFYHKDKFKTKFCSFYAEEQSKEEIDSVCHYGGYCCFAHTQEEILVELIHKYDLNLDFFLFYFKTVMCPFESKHEKSTCVYAHNLQDFRRNPKKYCYDKKNCSSWDNKKTILNYSQGCKDGYLCPFSHGWKESDFHPLNYKTTKCKNYKGNCEKGIICPFYHNYESKRIIDEELKKNYEFKLKNRVNQPFKFRYDNEKNTNLDNSFNSNLSNKQNNSGNKNNRSDIIYNHNNYFKDLNSYQMNQITQNNQNVNTNFNMNMNMNMNHNMNIMNSNPNLNYNNNYNNYNSNFKNQNLNNSMRQNLQEKMNLNNNNYNYNSNFNQSMISIGSNNSNINYNNLNRVNLSYNSDNNENYNKNYNKSFNIEIEKNNLFSTKNYFSTLSGNVFNTNNSFISKSGNGSDNEFSDYNIFNDLMSKRSISPVSSELENSYQILGKLTSQYKSSNYNLNKTQYSNLSQSNKINEHNNERDKLVNHHKEVIFENIKNKDKEIKELFNTNVGKCSQIEEEGEEEDNEEDKYDNELLEYLEENGLFIILKKIENFDLTQKQLINLNDENLIEMMEEKNKSKFQDLRKFLMKLDESNDVKDIFNSIDKSNIFDD